MDKAQVYLREIQRFAQAHTTLKIFPSGLFVLSISCLRKKLRPCLDIWTIASAACRSKRQAESWRPGSASIWRSSSMRGAYCKPARPWMARPCSSWKTTILIGQISWKRQHYPAAAGQCPARWPTPAQRVPATRAKPVPCVQRGMLRRRRPKGKLRLHLARPRVGRSPPRRHHPFAPPASVVALVQRPAPRRNISRNHQHQSAVRRPKRRTCLFCLACRVQTNRRRIPTMPDRPRLMTSHLQVLAPRRASRRTTPAPARVQPLRPQAPRP